MTDMIPASMDAIHIEAPGAPEMLRPTRRPTPRPGPGEVLIRVQAAGVNRPDVIQRQGHYPPPPGASDLPGLEVAGRVVALGQGVTDLQVGDMVCALVAGGGYAAFCVAPAVQCLPLPTGFDAIQAAALPENYFTVWHNLIERGALAAQDVVLIHGGTSGIGTTAIQIAKLRGARVFATAGSPEKARACEALGAERGIDYRQEDFVAIIRAATNDRGADLVLDMVGGPYLARNIQVAALEGRIVQIAFLQGAQVTLDLRPLMTKRLTLTGSTLRARPVADKGRIAAALKAGIWPDLAAGRLKPVIHAVMPLAEAAEAHRLMESSAHIGKIMLTLD